MEGSEKIKAFLDWLRETNRDFNIAVEDEQDANDEQQDILHSIELDENGYRNNALLATALKRTRRKRRKAKKQREKLQPVVDWYRENTDAVKSLERLLGAVRKVEKCTESRSYTHRTDVVARTLKGKKGAEK